MEAQVREISDILARFMPEYLVEKAVRELSVTAYPPRFAQDEPARALASLERIFVGGNQKHGNYNWKTRDPSNFLIKAERHRLRHILGEAIDESGEPHLIHSAANLLLASELLWKPR